MLGYDSPEEVMNSITSISKQIYAEPSRRDDLLTEALNKGGSISIENHYRRKDGSSWYGMLHLRIVFDKEGKPDYYEGFVEDITARKNIEQKLIESEEKYRSLINGLGEMMFRISLPNGKYEYVSPSVMQIYGYTQKDFLENPLLIMSIIHPDYAKYFYDNWMDLLQGNVAPLYEYKIIDRFGNEKWIQQSNKAIFNEEGNLIAIDGLCRDITKQKKSEIKILDQQQELEKLNEFTKIINSNSNITNILQEIYTYLRKETGFEIVWILLVSKKQDKLFSAENLSVFESEIEFDKDYFVNFRKKINESLGILYHTYQERIPFYCPDTTLSKRNITNHFTGKDYKLHQTDFKIQRKGHFKSMLQFPLILQNEVIGIINLTAHSKKVEISPSGINNMMRFADQIAGVIRNARLLEEAEEAKKEAEIEQRIAELARTETEQEKAKSEKLLLNILPEVIAKELKEQGSTKPVFYESVSVMFTDFKGFTKIAESLTPTELITELDGCFSYFDSLMERYNLEKLKTIGDSYMCAGGIPMANKTHAIDCILAALEIQSVMNQVKELKEGLGHPYWELRLGIHTGPLIAGVIGEKKFAYDVWGDTVNTASRMEASGIIGKVNISSATYELVKDFFDCEYRGKIQAKNKGEVEMYFVTGIKQKLSIDNDCKNPSYKFWMLHERVKNGETININDLEDRRKMEIPDIKKERRKKNKTKKVNQNEVEIVG
jgi:PAS domain S-box-containing protein